LLAIHLIKKYCERAYQSIIKPPGNLSRCTRVSKALVSLTLVQFGGFMHVAIKGTVGESSKNIPQDVKTVQALLNNFVHAGLLSLWPALSIDGVCGPKTKK
jgi:hypothetical protein